MANLTDEFVPTVLGRLHVLRRGSGPVTVLWHSLFLDSRSWAPLIDALAEVAPRRTIVAIDGPSHGRSEPVTRDFTFDDCARVAGEVLTDSASTSRSIGSATPGAAMSASCWPRPSRVGYAP